MVRTQLYLTEDERNRLSQLARTTGKKQSELIREAVDAYLAKQAGNERAATLQRVAGIWSDRNDLPDFAEVRRGWDRENADCG